MTRNCFQTLLNVLTGAKSLLIENHWCVELKEPEAGRVNSFFIHSAVNCCRSSLSQELCWWPGLQSFLKRIILVLMELIAQRVWWILHWEERKKGERRGVVVVICVFRNISIDNNVSWALRHRWAGVYQAMVGEDKGSQIEGVKWLTILRERWTDAWGRGRLGHGI